MKRDQTMKACTRLKVKSFLALHLHPGNSLKDVQGEVERTFSGPKVLKQR